ncbi:MAG: geranylgeranyl reductase family protein [Actinobacteria bacterium]|nr:MAG: geranylgeranyl reductase family protein [Actinomycetota bacterium]
MVVGAGPAGSATAYHLATRGVDVLMVDKAVFPREKVCGDGLTPRGVRAIQRMGIDPTEPGFTRVDGLRTYGVDGVVIDLRWPRLKDFPPLGVVRTRFDFDNLLAERAVKAGARFDQGTEARRPVMDGTWVGGARVQREGHEEEVKARFVVAADGASSRFAAHAGVRRDDGRPMGIAARRYYRIPRPQEPVLEAFVNLRDEPTGGVMAGYGWIFPLGDGVVNVGAGLLNTFKRFKEMSARKLMDVFVADLPPEWGITEENATGPVLSGPIPMGMNRRPLAVPGMLVVGDAGGLTNPFNGEGIAYAMETGELAAELIADALAKNRPALAHLYPVLLKERYARYYLIGRQWVRMIGHPRFMHFAVRHGFPRTALMRFALTFMANLTDGRDGSAQDRLMHALVSLAPER